MEPLEIIAAATSMSCLDTAEATAAIKSMMASLLNPGKEALDAFEIIGMI